MFADWRVHLKQSWKEEIFVSLDHALLMCEMMDPSTSKSVQLACAGALIEIQLIKDQLKKKNSFIPLLVALLPTIHSVQITPIRYSALPFCLT